MDTHMNIIKTTAPIDIEHLKVYFTDKSTKYVIDAKNSSLKGQTLLTYLSNLDIPCDVENFDSDLLEAYIISPFLVSIPSLEKAVLGMLYDLAGITSIEIDDMLIQFKEAHTEELNLWLKKIYSLPLYNFSTINDERVDEFISQCEIDETDDMTGINLVSLLKYEDVYNLFSTIPQDFKPTYFKHWFNEPVFKGKQFFSFWANENNPMFLLTYSIANGTVKSI